MRRRSFAGLVLVGALAGCAQQGTPGPAAGTGGVYTPSAAPSPDISYLTVPTKPAGKTETISGTVTAGVEAHCLLLKDAAGLHQLIFHEPALRAQAPVGAQVTLTGTANPGQMSTCQQGVPFIVTSVG